MGGRVKSLTEDLLSFEVPTGQPSEVIQEAAELMMSGEGLGQKTQIWVSSV